MRLEVAPIVATMLLSKAPHGGTIGKDKLVFQLFAEGQWAELLRFGVQCAADLANVRRRSRCRDTDNEVKREERAFMLVQLGELSSARQALEGAEVAVGNQETLEALRRQPAQFRDRCQTASCTTHLLRDSSWMRLGLGAT